MPVPTAQLLLSLWELDGGPYVADPRHVLARVVRRLQEAGYTPVVAAELEFYVVDPARGTDRWSDLPCPTGARNAPCKAFSGDECH